MGMVWQGLQYMTQELDCSQLTSPQEIFKDSLYDEIKTGLYHSLSHK